MWSMKDQAWARDRGISLSELERQVVMLRSTPETLAIDRPAVMEDGIGWLDADGLADLEIPGERVTTFVPASGAASRMFASLVSARAEGFTTVAALEEAVRSGRSDLQAALEAWVGREGLAIGEGLEQAFLGEGLERWLVDERHHERPKALVPLHQYADGTRTAVVEHLLEAAALVRASKPRVHFTLAVGWEAAFEAEAKVASTLLKGCEASLSWSHQHPATDTVALERDGSIFRDQDGYPLLRPGGHGSLLRNLEALGADLVVVKNIDNVTRDENRAAVVEWRRALVGRLVEVESTVHALLRGVDAGEEPAEAIDFAVRTFGRRGRGDDAEAMARDALERPIRVVGVVRNDGQPGGGPFWVREVDGTSTPQIMESAQIDRADPEQLALFARATHFNPVDMALSLRDPRGKPYPLSPLVDQRGWLRASKSWRGRPLRALERPGLWNGAMAGWNTIFVEVPSWTFRPVKELKDLLEEGHRGSARV